MSSLSVLLLVTAGATLLATLSQLLTGFGFALVLVPMLLLVAAPAQAVGVSILLGTVLTLVMAWRDRQHVDRPKLLELLAGSVIGLPLGAVALHTLSDTTLKWIIVASVTGALLVVLANLVLRNRRTTTTLVGIVSGGLLTASGVNGPPLVALLRANQYPPSVYRATIAAIFAVQNVLAAALLAGTGQITSTILAMVGAGLVVVPGAYWLGERLFRHIDAVRLRRGIIAMLALCLLSVLWFR